MDQIFDCSNECPTKNMRTISKPNREKVTNSPILEKCMKIVESKKRAQNPKAESRSEKTKTVNIQGKNLGDKAMLESKKSQLTTESRPVTASMVDVMVTTAIKSVKDRNGASFDEIKNHLVENHKLEMKLYESYVKTFLQNNVDKGVIEKLEGTAGEERFKMKMSEKGKKYPQKLISDDEGAKKSKNISVPDNKDLKEKRTTRPIPAETEMNSKDQPADAEDTSVPEDKDLKRKRTLISHETGMNSKDKAADTKAKKQKVVATPESKNTKIKAVHPPTSEMVMDSIKALKKRNGATLEEINKHIEENYEVNMKVLKPHVSKFLKKAVDTKALDKTDGVGAKERYKIKKPASVEKDAKDLRQKKGNVSTEVGKKKKTPMKKLKKKLAKK